jgi:hypothetical protein
MSPTVLSATERAEARAAVQSWDFSEPFFQHLSHLDAQTGVRVRAVLNAYAHDQLKYAAWIDYLAAVFPEDAKKNALQALR